MGAPQAVTEDDLKSRIGTAIEAWRSGGSVQASDRQKLLNAYYGRPYGDEVEGFSQVVSRDTLDTVEWMLAQLLRIFASDRYCEFEPVGPDDVKLAEQQSEYVQHVIMSDNEGFTLFHDWFKDALLLRNGVAHWGVETITSFGYETFSGLTGQQLEMLLMDANTQLVSRTTRMALVEVEGAPPVPVPLHDVRIKTIKREKRRQVICIPPEEFVIDPSARSIEDSPTVGHARRKNKSELLAMGFNLAKLENISFDEADDATVDQYARDLHQQTTVESSGESGKCWLYRLYLEADIDGDGLNELVECYYAGSELLSVEPAEEKPYAALTPVRMPHRYDGLSYADLVADVQRIKTVLNRQALDNIYLVNQPMREVVAGKVDMADLQNARIGGAVRVKEANSIREMVTPNMTPAALAMIAHMDDVATKRTGISANGQGIDAESLTKGSSGVAIGQAISQMMARTELVARIFAETGVKRLFQGVYGMIVRNPDVPRMVRLRNEWVNVDPRDWKERNKVTVTVGLGAGSRQTQLATLKEIGNLQSSALQAGLPIVTPINLYHTAVKFVETAGYKDVENWFTSPDKIPARPPQEDAQITIAKMSAQLEAGKLQLQAQKQQYEAQLAAAKLRTEQQKLVTEHERSVTEQLHTRSHAEVNVAEEAEQTRREFALKQAELAQEDAHFYDKLSQDAVLAREKIAVDAIAASTNAAADQRAMDMLEAENAKPLPA